MQSKSILFSVLLSVIIVSFGFINSNMTPSLPFKVSFSDLTEGAKEQVTCLAENIYFEAGVEPEDGKKAVAFVTINRLQSGFAKDICGVVKQKTGHTCQFSWYCDKEITKKRLTIKDTVAYNQILELSTNVFINYDKMEDVTEGATYYHADYINPKWRHLDKIKQIGRHVFYRHKDDSIDRNKRII